MKSGAGNRRHSRERVLQGLYQWWLSGNAAEAIHRDIHADPEFARADAGYFDTLWAGVIGEHAALAERLAPLLDRPFAAVSPVERAILVIGAWELVNRQEIPYRVVINEAIELGKSFGGTDGHKFVNGVLDRLAASVRPREVEERRARRATP